MIKEAYQPVLMAANSVLRLPDTVMQVGGFLAKTSGTISITNGDGVTVVDAMAVTAGVYTPIPFRLRGNGVTTVAPVVTLAGGASGTLGY